jgi:hypothetical protein
MLKNGSCGSEASPSFISTWQEQPLQHSDVRGVGVSPHPLPHTPFPCHATRWDQLLNAASSDLAAAQEEGEEGRHNGGSAPPDPAVLLNQFRSLVLQHYIERAPPCNLPPPPQQVQQRCCVSPGLATSALLSLAAFYRAMLFHPELPLFSPSQVHPMARKKKAAPKPGSEEEAELQREQGEAAAWLEYQRGAPQGESGWGEALGMCGQIGQQRLPLEQHNRGVSHQFWLCAQRLACAGDPWSSATPPTPAPPHPNPARQPFNFAAVPPPPLSSRAVRFLLPEDTGGASCSDVERATAAKPAGKRKRGKDAGASLEGVRRRFEP